MNNTRYPDFFQIADLYNVMVDDILDYQLWHNCFFVKIAGIGWRFVSFSLTRVWRGAKKVAKKVLSLFDKKGHIVTKEEKDEFKNTLYRVIRTWDNGSSYLGDRVESVLVQRIGKYEKPWWTSVNKSQGIVRNDILAVGYGDRLVKAKSG